MALRIAVKPSNSKMTKARSSFIETYPFHGLRFSVKISLFPTTFLVYLQNSTFHTQTILKRGKLEFSDLFLFKLLFVFLSKFYMKIEAQTAYISLFWINRTGPVVRI